MAITNFKTLHTNIKDVIKALGFKYVPVSRWYSLDLGVFPTALKDNAFTIKFPDMDDSTFESDGWSRLSVSIEFVLDAQNELYLKKLDDCLTAIHALRDLSSAEIEIYTEVKTNFQSQDIIDKILLTFNDIKFDIRSF